MEATLSPKGNIDLTFTDNIDNFGLSRQDF